MYYDITVRATELPACSKWAGVTYDTAVVHPDPITLITAYLRHPGGGGGVNW